MKTKKWYSFAGSEPHNQGQVIDQATGHTIAVTYSDEEGKNARLIAAAPELLDALIEALDQLQSWNPDGSPSFTMRRVEEVINKATQP